jgi:hypothetical protein
MRMLNVACPVQMYSEDIRLKQMLANLHIIQVTYLDIMDLLEHSS